MSPVTAIETDHWRLVAPWYRWERSDGLEPERAAEAGRPAIHKFVNTEFMTDFLADPQRSVAFDPDKDRVQRFMPSPLPGVAPNDTTFDTFNEALAVADASAGADPQTTLSRVVHTPGTRRKLFMPAHQRFYLVAISMHCEQPGYPKVNPDNVTEVGMVIRKRLPTVAPDDRLNGALLLRNLHQSQAKAGVTWGLDAAKARSRVLHPFSRSVRARVPSPSAATIAALQDAEAARRKLHVWAEETGVGYRKSGWVATGEGSFGAWVPMADEPTEVIEHVYPMRHLRPSPIDPEHAAHDGSIWYAPIPTASDQTTVNGIGRFNEKDSYEIRVFARSDGGDCPGTIVWSEPSEPFSLASFYDPDGCAQRPIEIRLPSFADLEATNARPSVRMTAPEGSSLKVPNIGGFHDPEAGETRDNEEVCFFAIPLITIVALFLLNIILPIVLFVFQLWWMLKLKFCLPPSIDFDADLSAAFDATPPEINLEAALSLEIDIDTHPDAKPVRDAIKDSMVAGLNNPGDSPDWALGDKVAGADPVFSPNALLQLAHATGGLDDGDGSPVFTNGVTYRPSVTRDMVVHP